MVGRGDALSALDKRKHFATRIADRLDTLEHHSSKTAAPIGRHTCRPSRSEEHTSELQSPMRISYAAFSSKKKILRSASLRDSSSPSSTTRKHTPRHSSHYYA